MSLAHIPTAVILHTPEFGDVAKIQGCYGLDAPVEIYSFTDMHPFDNPANSGLHDVVFFKADDIIIQKELARTLTAKMVVQTVLITSARRAIFGTFDRDYTYKQYTLKGMLNFMGMNL